MNGSEKELTNEEFKENKKRHTVLMIFEFSVFSQ